MADPDAAAAAALVTVREQEGRWPAVTLPGTTTVLLHQDVAAAHAEAAALRTELAAALARARAEGRDAALAEAAAVLRASGNSVPLSSDCAEEWAADVVDGLRRRAAGER